MFPPSFHPKSTFSQPLQTKTPPIQPPPPFLDEYGPLFEYAVVPPPGGGGLAQGVVLPALEELDVGGNPLTTGAGRKLLQLAQANPPLGMSV